MNKIFSIALMALVVASCQNSEDQEKVDTVTSSSIADSNGQPVVTSMPATTAAPAPTAGPATTAVPAPVTASKSGGSSAPNPAHGAPGHRCDIAVGAPLNSPASKTPPPAASVSPAPTAMPQMQTPAQPVQTGAGLNPAHGQPGHDCKIPVGQPLKS